MMIEGVGRWQHVVCYVVVENMRSKKLKKEEAGGIRAIMSRVRKLEMSVARTEIFPLKADFREQLVRLHSVNEISRRIVRVIICRIYSWVQK